MHDKLVPAMTKPIVALDLDGTLLNMGDLMHPKDKEILIGCKEVNFVFASGRQRFGIRKSMAANDLFIDAPIPFPMVLINGGALYLPGEELWQVRPFSDRVQQDLLQALDPYSDIPFVWQSLDKIYLMHPTPFAVELMKAIGVEPLSMDDLDPSDPFYKIICWSDENSHLLTAQEALRDFPVVSYVSTGLSVEFNPQGVNKGEGLIKLLEHLDGDKAEIYSVGDSENDLPLFPYARKSFVPSTAPLEIQKQAQMIIDPGPHGLLEPLLEQVLY
jgi:Cof subfamily protein (haloacid dehalogenase superfamily)